MSEVYIIDNGESYSDHCIYFVATEWPREVVEKVIAADNAGGAREAFLVGVASDFAWASECAAMPLEAYGHIHHLVPKWRPVPAETRELPLAFLRAVLELGKRDRTHQDHLSRLASLIAEMEASS